MTEPCVAQGLLLAKGPGVMKGYYNDEASTARAFVAGDGWFDTGDLGWRAPSKRIWFFTGILWFYSVLSCKVFWTVSSLQIVLILAVDLY